jgi:hypothetical protein
VYISPEVLERFREAVQASSSPATVSSSANARCPSAPLGSAQHSTYPPPLNSAHHHRQPSQMQPRQPIPLTPAQDSASSQTLQSPFNPSGATGGWPSFASSRHATSALSPDASFPFDNRSPSAYQPQSTFSPPSTFDQRRPPLPYPHTNEQSSFSFSSSFPSLPYPSQRSKNEHSTTFPPLQNQPQQHDQQVSSYSPYTSQYPLPYLSRPFDSPEVKDDDFRGTFDSQQEEQLSGTESKASEEGQGKREVERLICWSGSLELVKGEEGCESVAVIRGLQASAEVAQSYVPPEPLLLGSYSSRSINRR